MSADRPSDAASLREAAQELDEAQADFIEDGGAVALERLDRARIRLHAALAAPVASGDEAWRDRIIDAMPWYDEASPDYTELDAVIAAIRADTPALDVDAIAHKASQIGFTYGALGRDFEYVYKNVNDMLAAARLSADTEGRP